MPVRRTPASRVRVTPMPPRTPITELGLTAAAARGLTPAAKKLTRGDLVTMMSGEMPRAAQALTVKDLTSISQVFAASAKAPSSRGRRRPAVLLLRPGVLLPLLRRS